jgi:hypothetical protein
VKTKPLDARTLRAVVAAQRRRMGRNERYWDHGDWNHMTAFLQRLVDQADTIERKAKASKKVGSK